MGMLPIAEKVETELQSLQKMHLFEGGTQLIDCVALLGLGGLCFFQSPDSWSLERRPDFRLSPSTPSHTLTDAHDEKASINLLLRTNNAHLLKPPSW